MPVARDLMTPGPHTVAESETLVDAARMMASLDVGALPIRSDDNRLIGMLTDRDIVVKCLAKGSDPVRTAAGSLAQGASIVVDADDDVHEVLDAMKENQVRRLPVVDGGELVGIISQADIALALSASDTGETVEQISASSGSPT